MAIQPQDQNSRFNRAVRKYLQPGSVVGDQDLCPMCGGLQIIPSEGDSVSDCDFCLQYYLISLPTMEEQ